MIIKKIINPKDTAILVIDIQNDYCSKDGKITKILKLNVKPIQKIIPALINFLKIARKFKIPLIFTKMIEDPEYMKENAKIKIRSLGEPIRFCNPKTRGFQYYKIKPQKDDFELIKKSYDAFSNPKLERILKKKNIKNLIITGVNTSICVDTTIRAAFTKGYNIIVPQDLVSMPKERTNQHKTAIQVWKTVFAHVTNSKKIISLWIS